MGSRGHLLLFVGALPGRESIMAGVESMLAHGDLPAMHFACRAEKPSNEMAALQRGRRRHSLLALAALAARISAPACQKLSVSSIALIAEIFWRRAQLRKSAPLAYSSK